MSNTMSERAMLAALKFKKWSGAKIDRAVTAEVNAAHNAQSDASQTRKFLVDNKSLGEVNSARSQIRAFHLGNTLPWNNDGTRILPIDQYWYYRERMAQLIDNHDRAVADFIENKYPEQMRKARQRLGTMFDANEYPTVQELEQMYSAKYELWPLPESDDFRCALSDDEKRKIQSDMDEALNEKLADTTRDLWQRLHSVVQKAFDVLNEPDKKFHNTTLTNIADIVQLLPKLNITGDPEIEKMTKRVAKQLASLDADTMRQDEIERAKAASTADDILDAMAGYVGGR